MFVFLLFKTTQALGHCWTVLTVTSWDTVSLTLRDSVCELVDSLFNMK